MFEVIDSTSCRIWLDTRMLLPARAQSFTWRIVLRRGDRIHARQRFVEDEQLRIVHDRLRQLDALPHALAVGADSLVRRVDQVHLFERGLGGSSRRRVVEAVQPHERGDPLESGHALVEGVLLGAEPDPEVQRRVAPDRLAEDT